MGAVATYTIAEAAERSGFAPSALRYYEGIGLVLPSTRTDAGYRLYDDRALARLHFIARTKQLGCSLEEISDLVAIWDGERCGPVQLQLHRLVTAKIADARRQIDELTALTEDLQAAAGRLSGPVVDGPCGPGCACLRDGDQVPTDAPVPLSSKPEATIACTLDDGAVADRVDAWKVMLAEATVRTRTEEGYQITFERPVDLVALALLVAAEQLCCSFYVFSVTVATGQVTLDVSAPAAAQGMVEELFGLEGA